VSISHPSVLRELAKGDSVFLEEGTIRLNVERATNRDAVCRVVGGGTLFSGKGVNLPEKRLRLRPLTPKDVSLMRLALKNGADFVGLSFTTSAKDVAQANRIAKQAGRGAWIIAKIENRQAAENL